MKTKPKYLALLLAFVTMIAITGFNNVIAIGNNQGYTTSIIDPDGLKIEVGEIQQSSVESFEDYLKANINPNYANLEKFEAKDLIYVKHILAEDSKLPEEKTIDAMYDAGAEAFLLMNDLGTYLYDVDENSDYYVAFVDTMHDDAASYVTDYSFAYTNLNGEVITDAIYDYDTGIAYVPKKYTYENKNGTGLLNVQVELLQAVDSQNPVATFDAKVIVDEDIAGTFATEGTVSVKALTTEFGVRVALDQEAINNINRRYIRVKINDTDVTDFVYYQESGIIVFSDFPSAIDEMEITISQENVALNEAEVDETTLSAVTYAEMETLGYAGVWEVDGDIQEGQLIIVEGQDVVQDVYLAGEFHIDGYPMYNVASDINWTELTGKVLNGGSIDINNLAQSGSWIQHLVRIIDTVTVDAGNGSTITIPSGINWYLKCVHNATTFQTFHERVQNENGEGYPRDRAYEIRMRVLKVTDDYIIMGMLTSSLHTQAGAGIFKIEIEGGKGSLKLGKKDDYGNFVPGAKFSISGPDYYNEIITGEGPTQLDNLKKGNYVIKELESPYKFIKTNEEYQREVKSKEVTECWIPNYYQRGTVTLIKTDGDNKIEGSPRLDGAVFKLCAAEDIWEGNHKVYSANEVIDANIVTNVDGTTKVFTNMPIGKYYYEEVSNPYGYYKKDGHFDVEVKYKGQDSPNATDETALCNEEQTYNDIVIVKKIEETSNYPERILEGAEFTATLQHRADDYNNDPVVGVSVYEGNGVYRISHLPVGDYVIEETVVPPKTFKSKNFKVTIDEGDQNHGPYSLDEENGEQGYGFININGELVDTSVKMVIRINKVDYDRTDDQAINWTQGDANLEGARYQIYEYNEETGAYDKEVYYITVNKKDENGCWYAESEKLLVGKYMVKELSAGPIVKDGVTYQKSYAPGYLVDPNPYYFEQSEVPSADTPEVTHYHETSKEKVQRGAVKVTKYDNDRYNDDSNNDSDKAPSAGAILKLTLDSNPSIYYTVKLNYKGEGEFLETNDETHTSTAPHDSMKYYPYTIPVGEYTLTEVKEADQTEKTSFYVKPEKIKVAKQADTETRIEADEPVPVWLRVVKKDKTTDDVVGLAGAKFKIYDVAAKDFVSMKVGVGTYVDEFSTNAEGYFYTPQKLYAGEYVVYETEAPAGYYLDEEWRIPVDKNDLGDSTVSGKYVKIDKIATGLTADEVYPGGIEVGELVYETSIPNKPLYVNIEIIKTSEKIQGSEQDTFTYKDADNKEKELDLVKPKYKDKVGLEGVVYQIYAAEQIVTPDGVVRAQAGELMRNPENTEEDRIKTNSQGIAKSWDLFPGKYKIVEIEVPKGYLLDPNPKYITATNENQLVKSATATLELSDVRQKLGYKFKKVFNTPKYITGDEQKHAVFGIYTKDSIYNYLGEEVISPNTLVDAIDVVENNYAETATDLPEGRYYVKELYVTYPYALKEDIVDFKLEYNGDGVTPKVVEVGEDIENDEETGKLKFIKLSRAHKDNLTIIGNTIDTSNLDDMAKKMLTDIYGKSKEEVVAYLAENKFRVVPGAKYEIWLNVEGTRKLKEIDTSTGDLKVAEFTTDPTGMLDIDEIPLGEYYLKEVYAPEPYEIAEGVAEFRIIKSNDTAEVYQALYDTPTISQWLHKTDFFTGKEVPNCVFEIRDDEGKLIVNSITDEEGVAWIPADAFNDYKDKPDTKFYYKEIEAPEVYNEDGELCELNTQPHEFKVEFDSEGKFVPHPVDVVNYRPVTDVKFVKTDEEGNLVPKCTFELKSEEEGLYYKTGVTDENGIYVFEDVPQGWYTYTELDAPEEYDLDTTPHRVYVTGDEMIVDFVNTGDIPVVAIASLAVVCLAGVAFITVRKLKLAKAKND